MKSFSIKHFFFFVCFLFQTRRRKRRRLRAKMPLSGNKKEPAAPKRVSRRARSSPLRLEDEQAQRIAFATFHTLASRKAEHTSDGTGHPVVVATQQERQETGKTPSPGAEESRAPVSEAWAEGKEASTEDDNIISARRKVGTIGLVKVGGGKAKPPRRRKGAKNVSDPFKNEQPRIVDLSSENGGCSKGGNAKERHNDGSKKIGALAAPFHVISEDIPSLSRIAPIGLYVGSNEESPVVEQYEKTKGVWKRRLKSSTVYQAQIGHQGVTLNLGSRHRTSAEAAAAVDLAWMILHGSESGRQCNVLSTGEAIRALKAAGVPMPYGLCRVEPQHFKVTAEHKQILEKIVADALLALGANDEELCDILLTDLLDGENKATKKNTQNKRKRGRISPLQQQKNSASEAPASSERFGWQKYDACINEYRPSPCISIENVISRGARLKSRARVKENGFYKEKGMSILQEQINMCNSPLKPMAVVSSSANFLKVVHTSHPASFRSP
jgi:hypothetical protein